MKLQADRRMEVSVEATTRHLGVRLFNRRNSCCGVYVHSYFTLPQLSSLNEAVAQWQ